MADLRAKALGHLRSGAVEILNVNSRPNDDGTVVDVMAAVQGHGGRYIIDGRMGRDSLGAHLWQTWACTCRNHLQDACAHRAAVQLVTGSPTEVRPDTERVAQHAG